MFVSTGLNVGLNLLLVPRFGLVAAAATTVLTELILLGQYAWLLRRLLSQLDWTQIVLRPVLAAALMGALVLLLRDLPLAVAAASGALAYGALLLLLGVLGRDEYQFVRSLRSPLPAVS
jgi:O-antigen/teichoic acid export membrane protein